MRKLSKKISMLMVLAMLVSLFSGIVSASAASAWSFASSKYDVDVKETIVMDKNEYADFDLYKEGKEVTKATYTVKWASSDEDVVWVNAKTGQLRADKFGVAEAGDKAKISATFTNVKTQKSATRYFYIEIADAAKYAIVADIADEAYVAGEKYALAAKVTADGKEVEAKVEFTVDGAAATEFAPAKAGEYTIIATATIDGKAVATEKFVATVIEAGLVSAKQTAFNTVALTFGGADAAKAVAADTSKIAAVWVAGSNEINAFVKSAKVDEKNAAVVNVELYNSIAKDTTYKFTVAGKSAQIVGVDLTKYARIEIATTSVPAVEYAEVKVNFYNADGVLVDVKTTGFSLSADASGDYQINGSTIYFYDQYSPKSAVVTATYFMGYDANGNRIADLTATATLTSYNKQATNASNINAWVVRNLGETHDGAQWGGNSANLAVNDGAKQLVFKYTVTDIYGTPTDYYNTGAMYGNYGGFEYSTTNEGVVLVDTTTGILYPVAAGSAQIVVKSIASWDANVKNVIGVFNVNVVDSRLLTSIAPVVNKTKLSANTGDIVWIKPEAKDQFGAAFVPSYNVELVYADADVTVEIKKADGTWEALTVDAYGNGAAYTTTGSDNGVPYFEIQATAAVGYAKNVQIAVTATQGYPWKQITRVVNVSVKNAGSVATYSLDGLTTSFDLNFAGKPSWASGRWYFETAIKLNAYDSNGYFVKAVDFGKGAANKSAEGFYYEIYKGSEKLTGSANDPTIYQSWDNTYAFYAMQNYANAVDTNVSKMANLAKGTGTYTIIMYQYNATANAGRQITQKSIVVSDSSAPISVVQKDNKIPNSALAVSGADVKAVIIDELEKDLTFKRSGKDVAFEIADIDYTMTADGKRVYVTNVVVRETFDFTVIYNGAAEKAVYDRKLYGVGKVFEIDFNN